MLTTMELTAVGGRFTLIIIVNSEGNGLNGF